MEDAIDLRRTTRFVAGLIRLGLIHRDAEPIVWRLLTWRPRHQGYARVTITALTKDLRVGRARVVEVLKRLELLRVLRKQRSWVYRRELGKKVQDVNCYVFGARPPEFPGETAVIQAEKRQEAREKVQAVASGLVRALQGLASAMGETQSCTERGLTKAAIR